jgi:hypothetical protein
VSSKPKCPPVVVFIYKRPETTALVMEAVSRADPDHLYIVADGPQSKEDAGACAAARRIAESMAGNRPTTTIYSDTNLGLCRRIKSGLDHVFREVEEAIILEDDCVPTASFFDSCSQLLRELRHDSRVFQIAGFNYAPQLRCSDQDFIVSKYCLIWGWATWRRSWLRYRSLVGESIPASMRETVNAYCPDPIENAYWSELFGAIQSGRLSHWDAEWVLACWLDGGVALLPRIPLVSNVGFDASATHTTQSRPYWVGEAGDLPGCQVPSPMVRNVEAERVLFDHIFGGWYQRESRFWRLMFHHARPLFNLTRGDPSGWARHAPPC